MAQFCSTGSGNCYQQDSCFMQSQVHTHDYKYATVYNIYKSSGVPVDLYMTIYSPCALPDQLPDKLDHITNLLACKKCSRPFIMLIHGGGFRTGCRSTTADECMEFAKRGYVVAAIDYRLGWVPGDEKQSCKNFCFVEKCSPILDDGCRAILKDSLNFAMYRSLQDAAAAMRFIVHHAVNLNIDTNFLYIGGYSAGAIISANLCYMNQQELNLAMPGAYTALGLCDLSGNSFTDSYKIAGLFNNWGCLYDTVYIKGSVDKIPMIAFHGIDDSTVPFSKGFPLDCNNGAYGYYYGSSAMYKRLINNYPNLPVELYACYGGHGIFNNDPEKDKRSLYRIQKAICFFNRARNGDKTQAFIQINKNENKIPYQELDLISPVNCSYTPMSDNYVIQHCGGTNY